MSNANRFILTAAVLGCIGFILGLYMAFIRDFSLTAVHSHLNVLGWLSLAVYGVVYKAFPAMGSDRLVAIHYYLSTIGMVVMMLALALLINRFQWAAIPLVVAEIVVILGMFLFTFVVWRHRHSS